MGDPAGLSLYSARERAPSELDAKLILLAQKAALKVSTKLMRELLATASQPGATALYLDAIRRLLESPRLAQLEESEQLEVIELFRATAAHPPMTEKLLELLEHPHLVRLHPHDRRRLLTYAVGPRSGRHSAPTHAKTLMGFWLRRTQEVQDFLETKPGQPQVHHYLVEPSRPLHLLRTLADLDLLIVAFGPPNDPTTLSYSRTYHLAAGRAEAAVISPSPHIASSWKVDDPSARHPFEARSTTLTRLEELELVRWIEDNHKIGPRPERTRGEAAVGLFVNSQRFAEAVEPIANLVSSIRGPLKFHRTRLHRGVLVRTPRHRGPKSLAPLQPQNRSERAAPVRVGVRNG